MRFFDFYAFSIAATKGKTLISNGKANLDRPESLAVLLGLGPQELVDLVYVVCFAAVSAGIPLGAVWDEVQAANMRKVNSETGKVTRRPDGKILKPEGWYGPDIKKAVFGDTS